ncbi:MAG: carboxypeptidase-like regulatory domain-containing protein, partial [Thermomicrobiales bacterium]
ECTLLDNAVDRAVASLLLANGKLYAGLEPFGTSTKKQGLIWECQANVENQCSTFYNTGNAWARSMVAGGGYLWAAMTTNYLWRCNPDSKSCENWDWAGNWPDYYLWSISYDGADTVYAAVGISGSRGGVIWSCPTASANSCGNVLSNVDGSSVAAGMGSVFSSTQSGLSFGTTPFAGASSELYSDVNSADSSLIYIPPGGPVGVGGVSVQVKSAGALGGKLAKRCKAGKNPKATVTVEGPNGVSKTVKAGACALAKGGAVKRTFNLLDPGDYTVTVTAGKRTAQANFTITQDTTSRVNLKLQRGARGG